MEGDPLGHTPVLARQVCELFEVRPGETVLDCTVGLGGHACLFAEALADTGTLIGIDVDPESLDVARERLSQAGCRVELLQANFAEVREVLESVDVSRVDVVFADLGVSSPQLDMPARGFSFQRDGPLDMRMDPRLTVTAADLVNRLKERELSDVLYYNAQEMASRRISRQICQVRREGRITTTARLAKVVADALKVDPESRKSKIHPATRTFQALRMEVNSEIQRLEQLLAVAPDVLNPQGRIGVIAFHSVEDKPVKMDFRRRKAEGVYSILTKKPVVADTDERRSNPRSRSAKLRVAVRMPEERPM
ncbi:MAG: 16S rRNA (cytosine(1402)-N(4))-methyltransferase RsmH [Phycisphaerales bacterium]|nr:MAG: 16S rRNA (cytosine(1402)-N(4))-methyltransferase RsmH [Phycisphaerales bacterium]